MNDKFTEKQLSFGKILVLEQGHELSEMDIKAFSNASSVEKISITSRTGKVKHFIHRTVQSMIISKGNSPNIDLYFVKGKKATSILIPLATHQFVGAYCWTANEVKFAHNYCLLLNELENSRNFVSYCLNAHEKASTLFGQAEKSNIFTKHTRSLRRLEKHYGVEDIASLKKSIGGLLVNSW